MLAIYFVYGMTECGPICYSESNISNLKSNFSKENGIANIGSCSPSWSLRITGENSILSEGEVGNIEVFSSNKLFSGYFGKRTSLTFLKDGWFRTGDRGFIYNKELYITGRDKTKLVINSKKVDLEEIEHALRYIKKIDNHYVYGVVTRANDNLHDELSIYYVPKNNIKQDIDHIEREVRQILRAKFDLPLREIHSISADDIPRTATGKIKRIIPQKMLPLVTEKKDSKTNFHKNSYISFLWTDILNLDKKPKDTDHFFDQGGDSLALATFVSALEEHYKIEFSIDELLKNLKYSDICKLVARRGGVTDLSKASSLPFIESDYERIKKIETYVASWKGSRLYPSSLIVGRNIKGKQTPLFWVFQEHKEFDALANALGENQPLYALKSYSTILKVSDYNSQNIQSLVDRYLWELLAIVGKQPIILGGNCQGGMIALEIAQRLKKINRAPKLLVLMEWMVQFGSYDKYTIFLYGKNSHTASIYLENKPDIKWQEHFPKNNVYSINGEHGQYFTVNNVSSLVEILERYILRRNINSLLAKPQKYFHMIWLKLKTFLF